LEQPVNKNKDKRQNVNIFFNLSPPK